MQLSVKGAVAPLSPAVKNLNVFLNWSNPTPIDFDLIALALKSGGDASKLEDWELVTSFGQVKSLPGLKLHGDEGVTANTSGVYNEQADIEIDPLFAAFDEVFLGILDYKNTMAGTNGDFDDCNPNITVFGLDGNGTQIVDHMAEPKGEGMDGNAFMLAKLTRQGAMAKFEAVGSETLLKGFTVDQLHAWVQGCRA